MAASFHDLAKVELNEASQYYEDKSPGLGAAFLAEAERAVAAVVEYPESGPVVGAPFAVECSVDFLTACCTAFERITFASWRS